ncbi:hypothetical protein BT63DRAFT_298364 [Microthyrium microscopicum]|uniref:HD/PDEase domain-containing protein n=1 Tax=Microthyrium microscopicum TaxID=703497 RepID=A0A6A6U8C8_9PEZI|nr:hypothetical protein BT63DRAFT_298364 [Microthyrium microscopicum]
MSSELDEAIDLLDKAKTFAKEYMSKYDASHDYRHVERVVELAYKIEAEEQKRNPSLLFNHLIIALASLLHDVGDKKYLKPGEDPSAMVRNVLIGFGADEKLAQDVQTVINHVSYSSEIKDPSIVLQRIKEHPELAIVQDADRLDAIGAVGIARCFGYTTAAGRGPLDEGIVHFHEKLVKLESMMKTPTGASMARARTERVKTFIEWWNEENGANTSP